MDDSIYRYRPTSRGIPIKKLRQPHDHLTIKMEIPIMEIPTKTGFILRQGPVVIVN